MDAILIEDVETLGRKGDKVKVKGGYFRNYLFPRKKAVPCTKETLRWQAQETVRRAERDAKEKSEAEALAKRLSAVRLEIKAEVSESDKLYGSVTALEIAKGLEKQGHAIEENRIEVESPIKTVGDYTVKIKLHHEVFAEVRVSVKGKAPAKPEAAE